MEFIQTGDSITVTTGTMDGTLIDGDTTTIDGGVILLIIGIIIVIGIISHWLGQKYDQEDMSLDLDLTQEDLDPSNKTPL